MIQYMAKYQLLDCGNQQKLEMLGEYKVIRPCPQAMWTPNDASIWGDAVAEFVQSSGEKGYWKNLKNPDQKSSGLEKEWIVQNQEGLNWVIQPNEYGNIGIFTEHWIYSPELINWFKPKAKVLNLFTYSGSNCVTLAKNGMQITAVDSSRAAMDRYVNNLKANDVGTNGQRLILEDAFKFIAREARRGSKYDAVMIDAPSYGRGTKGEVFKIEEDLLKLLSTCNELLEPDGKMVITLHSPRFTPKLLEIMLNKLFGKIVTCTEIVQNCISGGQLPSGFLVKIG
jgi:23S rRNA (cytosine1962-C5)-methyltransferase